MKLSVAETRVQAQRERILAAAQKCFIERGFHAASMANIAEASQMSPGLIYRYFKSKSEIVQAIIELQLQLTRQEIHHINDHTDLATRIAESFCRERTACSPQSDSALFLEISAEATRDPAIAATVRGSDQILISEFRQWLGRDKGQGGLGIAAAKTQAVSLLLQCLFEGMKVREAREPDFDHALMQAALEEFLPPLLATPADT